MGKKFSSWITAMYGKDDMSEDDKIMLDNLSQISEPETMDRGRYHELVTETFGNDILDVHDQKDIHRILNNAKAHIPTETYDNIIESGSTGEIESEALALAKDYHPAVLAIGVSEALYNATDHRVAPSLILPANVSANAISLADTVTSSYEEGSYEDSSDEDAYEDDEDEESYDDY